MKDVTVACYYFPNYHPGDRRNERLHGAGWTEWELVTRATPRFPGHRQPRLPAWGTADESDPRVMAAKIGAAADHGIDAFIFDWYWYDDGPFLERALDRGFLAAPNNGRLQFALMWANHDWLDIHPHKRGTTPPLLYPGKVAPATFDAICGHVTSRYFTHPSYMLVDGRPYFSVYDLGELIASFGSVPAARAALDAFRAKARAAGFDGLHLNAVLWGRPALPDGRAIRDPFTLPARLGFDSVTSYVWIHHWNCSEAFMSYDVIRGQYFDYWSQAESRLGLPYHPNVTMGWDPSPRTVQSDRWDAGAGHTFCPLVTGNTPEAFRAALAATRSRLVQAGRPSVMTINAWNEWTEGSYLEPDEVHGMRYLEAVRDSVCGTGECEALTPGAGHDRHPFQ